MKDYAIIMAGGVGERLWPLSTTSKPKQLLRLFSEKTMIEETIRRVEPLVTLERIIIVAGEGMKNAIMAESPFLKDENFLVEPIRKNTAAAVLYAAHHLVEKECDAMMYILTSDHYINPKERFLERLKVAAEVAQKDKLVLFGIEPTRPETGYGYIEADTVRPIDGFEDKDVFHVRSFKEKPVRAVAEQYYMDNVHLWNSGMFIWKASTIIREAEKCIPHTAEEFNRLRTDKEKATICDIFGKIDKISIDKGVMEKATNVAVLRANFVWDDIGSFLALLRIFPQDENENVMIGRGNFSLRSYQNIVFNESSKPLVIMGLTDSIVVKTDDVVLVMSKPEHANMNDLLDRLKDNGEFDGYL
jgi:mannose-1-phosphate guanylyltransferase